MRFLEEIRIELLRKGDTRVSEIGLYKACIDNGVEPKARYGSDGKSLGYAISDEDCQKLFFNMSSYSIGHVLNGGLVLESDIKNT